MLERPPEEPRRLRRAALIVFEFVWSPPVLIEPEPRLYSWILTRFLHANRYTLRSKTLLRANR